MDINKEMQIYERAIHLVDLENKGPGHRISSNAHAAF